MGIVLVLVVVKAPVSYVLALVVGHKYQTVAIRYASYGAADIDPLIA
jgi:hypothetical protein